MIAIEFSNEELNALRKVLFQEVWVRKEIAVDGILQKVIRAIAMGYKSNEK